MHAAGEWTDGFDSGSTRAATRTRPCCGRLRRLRRRLRPLPHMHTWAVQVFLSQVAVHTDYKLDESYTPAKLSVRRQLEGCTGQGRQGPSPLPRPVEASVLCLAQRGHHALLRQSSPSIGRHTSPLPRPPPQVRVGTSFSDLREVKCVDLHEPQGWVVLPLAPEGEPG